MSKIAWTDESWNPIIGCSKVSAGCQNCYAEKMAGRLSLMDKTKGLKQYQKVVRWHHVTETKNALLWNGRTEFVESALEKPLHWRKPRKIFVCSMGDLFHESVPFEWIDKVMAVVALCPQHTFQILTKRPERMKEYFDSCPENRFIGDYKHVSLEVAYEGDGTLKTAGWPLPNLWLCVTAENQEMADKRIPILLDIPASKRFVSCEPLLDAISLQWKRNIAFQDHRPVVEWLDWVIVGAESGAKRRECKPEWVDNIVRQCKDSDVACFVKQIFDGKQKIECPAQYPQEFPKGA